MPAGLDLLSPGGEGRVPRNARRDFHGEVLSFYCQRDRILGKVTFGQNRSAPHTLYYKYKLNYSPILHVLPAWLDFLCVSAL
jgi:hypothetical protein